MWKRAYPPHQPPCNCRFGAWNSHRRAAHLQSAPPRPRSCRRWCAGDWTGSRWPPRSVTMREGDVGRGGVVGVAQVVSRSLTALSLSGSMSACGTLERTKGMAPAMRSARTGTASSVAGLNTRAARPAVESNPTWAGEVGGGGELAMQCSHRQAPSITCTPRAWPLPPPLNPPC